MRIAIASDHAGFELKEHVKAQLESAGHDVVDVGPESDESTALSALSVLSDLSPRMHAAEPRREPTSRIEVSRMTSTRATAMPA